MFCERCHSNQATVHLTIVLWPATGPTNQNFCEACYPEIEAEQIRAYNPAPNFVQVSVQEVENMTAVEYVEASARAARNGADKPRFKQILDQLERLPKT